MAGGHTRRALGCEEILAHTWNIAKGLGVPIAASADLAARIVARRFPCAPTMFRPWHGLRWAERRMTRPGREPLGPDRYWHPAPLTEWDGTIKKPAVADRVVWMPS